MTWGVRLAVALGLAAVGGLTTTAVVGQTFRTGVDVVAVDVLVTRGGRPVTGLTADDFSVRDNDVPQRVDSVRLEDVPITLLLVLDTSGSVGGAPLVQLRAAAEAAADALRSDDRVGLVTFSDRLRMVVEPPSPPSSLADALRRVRATGATALYDATFAALALREQTVGRTLMLVFSDGYDTASWLDPLDVLDTAHRSDVVVYGVYLDRLAGDSWGIARGAPCLAAGYRLSRIFSDISFSLSWSRTPAGRCLSPRTSGGCAHRSHGWSASSGADIC